MGVTGETAESGVRKERAKRGANWQSPEVATVLHCYSSAATGIEAIEDAGGTIGGDKCGRAFATADAGCSSRGSSGAGRGGCSGLASSVWCAFETTARKLFVQSDAVVAPDPLQAWQDAPAAADPWCSDQGPGASAATPAGGGTRRQDNACDAPTEVPGSGDGNGVGDGGFAATQEAALSPPRAAEAASAATAAPTGSNSAGEPQKRASAAVCLGAVEAGCQPMDVDGAPQQSLEGDGAGGQLSLERLRALTADEARDYLMSIDGLGRKSVACILLLALKLRCEVLLSRHDRNHTAARPGNAGQPDHFL